MGSGILLRDYFSLGFSRMGNRLVARTQRLCGNRLDYGSQLETPI